jgi:hypothetical protein
MTTRTYLEARSRAIQGRLYLKEPPKRGLDSRGMRPQLHAEPLRASDADGFQRRLQKSVVGTLGEFAFHILSKNGRFAEDHEAYRMVVLPTNLSTRGSKPSGVDMRPRALPTPGASLRRSQPARAPCCRQQSFSKLPPLNPSYRYFYRQRFAIGPARAYGVTGSDASPPGHIEGLLKPRSPVL